MAMQRKPITASQAGKKVLAGKVQTILGPIEPDQLGITQTHEHLLLDSSRYFHMPEEASERAWVDAPFTMDRKGGVPRRWNYACRNPQLLDVQTTIEEVLRFKHAGGRTLVDTTSIGLCRDPLGLARISRATGINVVMGGSYYMPLSYPPGMERRSEDDIAEGIVRDITVGVGDTGVCTGVIGEIGNVWPMTDIQRRVLRASARASVETGAPILIHPGLHLDSPPAIIETLTKAGAFPQRIIMGHLGSYHDKKWFKELAQTGCYLEWDWFGLEDTSLGPIERDSIVLPSDVQTMDDIEFLVGQGFGERIVIGHDVCQKMQLTRNGGKGYAHILENIVPRMRKRGFTEQQLHAILVDNPARILAFV